jgi:hypothetical protein
MADIKADPKQFWQRLLGALAAGMPARQDGKGYSNKEIEAHYGVKLSAVSGLFAPTDRNYQAKWSDAEMYAFNAGEPAWDIHKTLLASIMWSSRASSRCKSLSVTREQFESAVMAVFDERLSDLENWRRGCEAAERLAESRFSGDFAKEVTKSVIGHAAHFIGKLTNSNVTTGAILALPDPSPQPYLYSGSVGKIRLDCWSNSSHPQADHYKAMRDCSERVRGSGGEAASAHDVAIAAAFDQAVAALGSGEDRAMNRSVDYRLRQIVLPKNGRYVALTPLGAAGISEHIFRHDDLSGYKILLPIGGTKPGNVTSIRSALYALVRDVPSLSYNGIAVYLRLLKRGYSIVVRKALRDALDRYYEWFSTSTNTFVDGRNSLKARQIELASSGIYSIVGLVMGDIQDQSNEVMDYLETLDPDDRQQKENALINNGPIEAAIATGSFSREFIEEASRRIVRLIENAKYKPTKESRERSVPIAVTHEDHERRLAVVSEIVSRFLVRA